MKLKLHGDESLVIEEDWRSSHLLFTFAMLYWPIPV